uniref:Lipocalin/cytosolic fatty-acid binding domain-containing protein n=1 Tax=Lepeophtheirus salmonis TaxID=72036 RepID=A0A0K2U8F1_LEPSM
MKCFIIVALVLVGVTTSEVSKPSFLFQGSWLEMKERRSGIVEFLMQLEISEGNAVAYSKGPTTMQCIQLTEEGYKITGIQPDGSPYNASITWRKEARRPYSYDLDFDAEVFKDNATNHNGMRFTAYKKDGTPLFFTQRTFTSEGYMNYSHTNVEAKLTGYTLYQKQE